MVTGEEHPLLDLDRLEHRRTRRHDRECLFNDDGIDQ